MATSGGRYFALLGFAILFHGRSPQSERDSTGPTAFRAVLSPSNCQQLRHIPTTFSNVPGIAFVQTWLYVFRMQRLVDDSFKKVSTNHIINTVCRKRVLTIHFNTTYSVAKDYVSNSGSLAVDSRYLRSQNGRRVASFTGRHNVVR